MSTEDENPGLPFVQTESFLMKLGPFSPPELRMFADAVRQMSDTNSDESRVDIVRDFARRVMRAVELQKQAAKAESELEALLPKKFGPKSVDPKGGMLELGKTVAAAVSQLSDVRLARMVMELPPVCIADFRSAGLSEDLCARLAEVLPAEITWGRDNQELFHAYLVGNQLLLQVRKHGLTAEQASAKILSTNGLPAGAIDDWARVGFAGDDLQLLAEIAKVAVEAKAEARRKPAPGCDCIRCTALRAAEKADPADQPAALRAVYQAEAEGPADAPAPQAEAAPAADPALQAAEARVEEIKSEAELTKAVTP